MPIPFQTSAEARAVPDASNSGRKPGKPEPYARDRGHSRVRNAPEAVLPGTRTLATGPPRRPGSLRMPDGRVRWPVPPGSRHIRITGGCACRRAGALAPPLCLVGCGAGKQAVLLAPGSSLPGPSHRVSCGSGVFRVAPRGQWRDRVGLSPNFPFKLRRAPVFRSLFGFHIPILAFPPGPVHAGSRFAVPRTAPDDKEAKRIRRIFRYIVTNDLFRQKQRPIHDRSRGAHTLWKNPA